MSLPICPQEEHFNVNGFERETEERFIQILLHEKVNGWLIWPHKVRRSLYRARDLLKSEFNGNFSMEQLQNHLNFLSQQKDTFGGLRENPLVRWEYIPNTFHAYDILWNELREVNKDVEWYYFEGEYAYKELLHIFSATCNALTYWE